ncbi:DUF1294 domain-containing protein [Aurantimonas sp. A2-1-M11]|uniref:DUF1294 domain-containing protein n=1 Tax=Aurantimonas sp. A2-1-M11 TaxID=3113712 RepID=UPI002F93D3D3
MSERQSVLKSGREATVLAICLYLLTVNVAAYWAFVVDKTKARAGVRRMSEQALLTYALIGGSVGAIAAQQIIRHKTRKEPFRTQLWAIAALQTVLVVGLATTMLVLGPDVVLAWAAGQIS